MRHACKERLHAPKSFRERYKFVDTQKLKMVHLPNIETPPATAQMTRLIATEPVLANTSVGDTKIPEPNGSEMDPLIIEYELWKKSWQRTDHGADN